jgi:hypothetical protein
MGSAMGKGRELGLKLREWIEAGTLPLDHATGLANRMIDVLGADDALKAPVRDLASQPLLLRALDQRGGAQRSAIQSLLSDLSSTYTAQVMEELTALIEAATGVSLPERPSSAFPAPSPAAPLVSPEGAAAPALTSPLAPQRGSSSLPALRKLRNLSDFAATLERLGPGLALAAATALVLHWGAGELDTWVLRPWRWNGALVLAGVLLLVQLLALLPWLAWKRQGPLRQAAATDPRRAWNWVTAPWIHHNGLEAGLNVLVLLAILGTSPLSLADGVLRYCLTCLATMALGVFVALHRCRDRVWDGAWRDQRPDRPGHHPQPAALAGDGIQCGAGRYPRLGVAGDLRLAATGLATASPQRPRFLQPLGPAVQLPVVVGPGAGRGVGPDQLGIEPGERAPDRHHELLIACMYSPHKRATNAPLAPLAGRLSSLPIQMAVRICMLGE